jgi:predicted metal-dependent phosphoesterase TrpH
VIIDLHLHTLVSDGELDPCGLLEAAASHGITRASIADHDALGAYAWEDGRVFSLARRLGIDLVVGVELDADLDGQEVHLLGYDVRPGSASLEAHLARVQGARFERARREIAIVEGLLGPGSVREADVFIPGRQTLMKPHFIHPLLARGAFPTYEAANAWYRQNVQSGITVAKPPLPAAISLVHEAGGWAILAHPGYYEKSGVPIVTRLAELAGLGLDGVELDYPYHLCSPERFSQADVQGFSLRLGEAAARLGLRVTRGSDCHTRADFARVYGAH